MPAKPPYFRLSLYYFCFFGALGSFVPYWSVYLHHLDYTAVEIGQLLALFLISKMLAPFALGWAADHYGKRMLWIRISALLAVFGFMPAVVGQDYLWIVLAVAVGGFFWNASLPQFEVVTLNHLGDKSNRYSWVRLWGSIGFIAAVLCLPYLFKYAGIHILPLVMVMIFALLAVSTVLVSDKDHAHATSLTVTNLPQLLRHPMVLAFFLACILQSTSHGGYYTFFSIYLEDHHYSRGITGWMWALGVIAEVILFIFLYRLFENHAAHRLFGWSLLLTAIRWFLLAYYVDNLFLLIITQILHAASFGLFHASAIHLIHDWFPGRLQGRGQALYSGLSFGLGGAIGSMLSGYLWEYTSALTTFNSMALLALAAWLLVVKYIRASHL